ncbi:hypothetical protein TWF481_005916 [Arthrobotrys musiformis]|uniref:R3H-associated N-terminal domain-containing protein n=1 Tax=Arthrobotrys musiformis TaxID=47236 RepID=A0AAV9WFR9_9PEZI
MAVFPTPPEHSSSAPQPQSPAQPPAQPPAPVTIPLDQPDPVVKPNTDNAPVDRRPLRRDSMKRREALIKGKEGTRRRQRWENDNFLNNPSFTPPSPEDFSPTPLHPRRTVRYEFATLWDPSNPLKYGYSPPVQKKDETRVPKNLKDRLKRSKGATDLLKSLEEEVRRYAATLWGCIDEYRQPDIDEDSCDDMDTSVEFSKCADEVGDSEDEEIVFVPRMETIAVTSTEKVREVYTPIPSPPLEKPVFEAADNDQGASFGRWLVHSIALYYGLRSWSETQGNPAKRIAFVGAQPGERKRLKAGRLLKHKALPRPLWMML